MQSEDKKIVFKGNEVVIFENGWWMKRELYDHLVSSKYQALDRNAESKEITILYLPPRQPSGTEL